MSSIDTSTGRGRGATRRRWWLLPIGASAGMAVWSGWVGLGGLTGFGVITPLPGIWDDLQLNTAITLPIGMEAYAMFALSVATSTSEQLDGHTRRFAWRSSVAALILGGLGQVAYHLMAAAGWTAAPWGVTAFVSCIPVAVLGMASYLWHLTSRSDAHAGADPIGQPSTQSDGLSEPLDERADGSADGSEPVGSGVGPDGSAPVGALHLVPTQSAEGGEVDGTQDGPSARAKDLARAREAIQSGDLQKPLTADGIRDALKIGLQHARAVRDILNAEPDEEPAEA